MLDGRFQLMLEQYLGETSKHSTESRYIDRELTCQCLCVAAGVQNLSYNASGFLPRRALIDILQYKRLGHLLGPIRLGEIL